jgi:hypothetical protein
MKKLTLFLIMLFTAAALAQDLPRIAVYVTGDFPENEKNALGTRMLAALIKSGHYRGIERSNAFLAKIEEEHVKQRSGAIDDSHISELGRMFGVQFVCIADITPAFGAFQLSARVINVETAEIVLIGEAQSRLRTMNDFAKVSDRIVNSLFSEHEKRQIKRVPKTNMSIGAGGFFSGDFGGGIIWNNPAERMSMPYYGGGGYMFFDAVYAEVFVGYSAGSGRWVSDNIGNSDALPDMARSYMNFGVFGKYPVSVGQLKVFPLLGIDYEASVSGRLKYARGGEYWFDGGADRPKASSLSALWIRFGGGADFDLSGDMYLRAQALYGVRTGNAFENNEAKAETDRGHDAETRRGHGMSLRVGIGFRF